MTKEQMFMQKNNIERKSQIQTGQQQKKKL